MTELDNINSGLFIRSHTARDFLQSAALFKHDKQVVWEYVSNGLEYVDEGINPIVKVTLDSRSKIITISDNGRGMDWEGLKNFFIMHGENIDRKKGKFGRGMFGTGKCAAFGIADVLRIYSVRNWKKTIVELKRSDIDAMDSKAPIPVKVIEKEIPTDEPNGTLIEINEIHLKSINQSSIIQYVEKQISKWRNATVFINNHECEFVEPPVLERRTFNPEGDIKDILGDVDLIIKVTSSPLAEGERGVSIYSEGILFETTLAGCERRDMSQFIYGEIDVPRLSSDKSPIPPFDMSRSMRLNPNNKIVKAIYAFIGQKIDLVRRELVNQEKERKASEEAKKLQKRADEIAKVINEDFIDFRARVAKARAKSGVGTDLGKRKGLNGGMDKDLLSYGSEYKGKIIDDIGGPGSKGGKRRGGEKPRTLGPIMEPTTDPEGKKGSPIGEQDNRYSYRGGFSVQFKPMGKDENRALYVRDERAIYINIDHPQLALAKGDDTIENPIFLRLAYEVSFSEYAIALAHELNENQEYLDTSDPIIAIRETINRIARKAAYLYSS